MRKVASANKVQLASIVLAAFLLLIVNREFGVADNGDFTRYMGDRISKPAELNENWPAQGSEDWERRFFSQPIFYWTPGVDEAADPWFTSASLFWALGESINEHLFDGNVLNMRYVGLPFFLLQLLGVVYVLRRFPPSTPVAATAFLGIFVVMTDARITAFYNSLYAESVPILAVLLAFAFLAGRVFRSNEHPNPGERSEEVIFSALVLFLLVASIFSKRQYVYFLIPALLFVIDIVWVQLRLGKRAGAVAVFLSALCLFGAALFVTKSQRIENAAELNAGRITSYHALYYGLLPHAENPRKLMEELGLPLESSEQIGHSAWNSASMELIAREPNINLGTFLSAIAADPSAYAYSWLHNAGEVGNFDVPLGMVYGESHGYPPALISSSSVVASRFSGIALLGAIFLLSSVALVRPLGESPESRFASRLLTVLLLSVVIMDVTVSTFDGQQEARKHVIVSSVCIVLSAVLGAVSLVRYLPRRSALSK